MKEKLSLKVNKFTVLVFLACFDFLVQIIARRYGVGMENRGVALGLLGGIGIFPIAVVWMILGGYIFCRQIANRSYGLWLVFIGGGVNLLTRISTGSVWDYIPLLGVNLWVNTSDILVSLGVLLYILGR